jgi:hypothetical protein
MTGRPTLGRMAYVSQEARQHLLDTVAEATEAIGTALAVLGAAYEQVDDATADRLEEQLFRPVQLAFGRARRTYSGFAGRHGLPDRTFAPGSAGPPSHDVRVLLGRAADAVTEADLILTELQDSMLPVEVGDAELRAGLAEVREILADLGERARDLVRVIGR